MTVPEQWLIVFYVANQVLSALVQALPQPSGQNAFYMFAYKFLSLLIADFKSYSAQLPQPMLTASVSSGAITTTTVPAAPQVLLSPSTNTVATASETVITTIEPATAAAATHVPLKSSAL